MRGECVRPAPFPLGVRHPEGDGARAPRALALVGAVLMMLTAACRGPERGASASDPVHVSMSAPDGGVVEADEYGAGRRAVVLVPGGRYTKDSWAPQAVELATAGYRVLAINTRGKGSSRAGSAGPEAYELDVLGAVRWARETGSPWVAVIGASFGGWAAAEAAAGSRRGEINRLVLLAHSPIENPERIRVPALFILAENDPTAQGGLRLDRVRDQYERAGGPKELVLLPGDAHAQAVFRTEQGERLMGEIERFLAADR